MSSRLRQTPVTTPIDKLVGFGAVERQDEQDTMIESFARLVQKERGLLAMSVLYGALS